MKTLPFIDMFLLIITSANWSYASDEDGITITFALLRQLIKLLNIKFVIFQSRSAMEILFKV